MTAFLGIDSSLTGRRWIGPPADLERLAEGLAQQAALPLPVARVLAERGVPPAEAAGFLAPKLRDLLPDPLTLRDITFPDLKISRETGYAIGFFAFWAATAASSASSSSRSSWPMAHLITSL